MTIPNPQGLMYEIISRREEMNLLASRAIGVEVPVFEEMSLPMPKLNPAELGFIRAVSWLYVLYHEAGKVGVGFLAERFPAYYLDPENFLVVHYRVIQSFRTYLQHNLDSKTAHDLEIREACERWLAEKCGTPFPGSEDQWNGCLVSILSEALNFLDALNKCIREIESDESRNMIVQAWIFQLKRYHPPHEFDTLISEVASDMGRGAIDSVRLRLRNYDKWTNDLRQLHGDYEFDVEARKLIEHTLLTETAKISPITGKDVMEAFNVPPGAQVGRLVERGYELYLSDPCTKELLLQRLMQDEVDHD